MIICAFPCSGKTSLAKSKPGQYVDFDYGKFRDMFGVSFSSEKHRGRNLISQFYGEFAERLASRFVVLVNEPSVQYPDAVYVVPSFSRDEWLERVQSRGDDLNADWVKYIYGNFDRCVEDWIQRAVVRGAQIKFLGSGEHLSDVL